MTTSIIFDTETTGLTLPSVAPLEAQPRIIELAIARVENGSVIEERSWLLNPECSLSAEITKITGLTDDDLKDAPKFREALAEIEEAFAGADQLFAHNAPFDCALLDFELRRAARTGFPWPAVTICTVQEHQHLFGHWPKLTELYERILGRPLAQTHRAADDVRALVEILLHEGAI